MYSLKQVQEVQRRNLTTLLNLVTLKQQHASNAEKDLSTQPLKHLNNTCWTIVEVYQMAA
jgi:hypothetical protein